MNRNYLCTLLFASIAAMGFYPLAADTPPSSTESRLRDALRTTMLQLRDAQTQVATLQETQAQSDKDKTDLNAKLDALNAQVKSLNDQAIANKAASEKALTDLQQNNMDLVTHMVDDLSIRINSLDKPGTNDKAILDKEIAELKVANPGLSKPLDQYATDIQLWTAGYEQYVLFANKTEKERSQLAVQVIMLQRVVTDRETKNLALYIMANDILERYEKFSLGDALSAKEPFIGVTRVKLQEYVQDYKDKIETQRISIGQSPADAMKTSPIDTASTAKQ